MAGYNDFVIATDARILDGKTVNAYATGTYLCSASLTFSPVSGLSSADIALIEILGTNVANFSISSSVTLPYEVVNDDTGNGLPLMFNARFANDNPTDLFTSYPVTVRVSAVNCALSAATYGTATENTYNDSSTMTVSGGAGWRGQSSGRIWSTHTEHMRMRNLGYI